VFARIFWRFIGGRSWRCQSDRKTGGVGVLTLPDLGSGQERNPFRPPFTLAYLRRKAKTSRCSFSRLERKQRPPARNGWFATASCHPETGDRRRRRFSDSPVALSASESSSFVSTVGDGQ
jgi:hypothetical protein